MSFLKSLFAVSLTGASSVGGTLIYQSAVPGSGKDVLIKEGYYFLGTEDNYYKAIYEDHKEDIKKVESLKNLITSSNDSSQIKQGCETELPKPYSGNNQKRKELVNLCTSDGIITVKARLISIGKSSFIIDESDTTKQDKQYKIIFAIYRYSERFENFFEGGTNDKINKETEVDTGYPKLKNECESGLKKPHKSVDDLRYFKHVSGWCSKFEAETFINLAKKRDVKGELDETGSNKGNKGKHTSEVKKYVVSSDKQGEEIDDNKIKTGCENNKNETLDKNASYQDKFVVFLSICKKTDNPSSPDVSE